MSGPIRRGALAADRFVEERIDWIGIEGQHALEHHPRIGNSVPAHEPP